MAVGEHDAAQALADDLRAAGFGGLLSPSAALPWATNLTLFGQRYEKVLLTGFHDWRNPNPRLRLPCHLAAECGPPVELVTRTCFAGMRHDAYREFLRASGSPEPGGTP